MILFVGAGPGDPELITVKGKRALEEADVVLYAGSLVPAALLQWTRSGAECVDSAGMHLEQQITLMADAYRAGKRVVRLHTGDPAIYGAIGEQMAGLDAQGIPYAVIPGVSSFLASAAALPTTLLAISHSRIAGSENRRLPTSIRCGTRLRLRSA